MKKLKLNLNKMIDSYHSNYTDDIERIVKVFADRGYEITQSNAIFAWESYSSEYAAGWLILPVSDESIYNKIRYYFEEDE